MKIKLLLTIFLSSCSFTVIPLPENAQHEKRQLPAMFVNQDVTEFKATATEVSFASLRSTEPMKTQAEGGKEIVKIISLLNLAETGIEAAENLGSEAIK